MTLVEDIKLLNVRHTLACVLLDIWENFQATDDACSMTQPGPLDVVQFREARQLII